MVACIVIDPQEILGVLTIAGAVALSYVFPISIAIVILLLIVTISYEQTIHAYPGGGGAYIVARDNLGELPAQTAGAALLTDYVLTVAVSVTFAVASIALSRSGTAASKFLLSITAKDAPLDKASFAYLFPSKLSPFKLKKTEPGITFLESVETGTPDSIN